VVSLLIWSNAGRPYWLAATPYKNLEALLARRLTANRTRIFISEHNDLRWGHSLSVARHQAILGALQGRLYPEARRNHRRLGRRRRRHGASGRN